MRTLLIMALGLLSVALTGCSAENTLAAGVPGQDHHQSSTVSSAGVYTLYHVVEVDMWGSPTKTEKVVTVQLNANDHIGFEYVLAPDKMYNADAQSDIVAYAGTKYRKNLGPLQTMDEHYYWANPDAWDGYWASHPGAVLGKRALLY